MTKPFRVWFVGCVYCLVFVFVLFAPWNIFHWSFFGRSFSFDHRNELVFMIFKYNFHHASSRRFSIAFFYWLNWAFETRARPHNRTAQMCYEWSTASRGDKCFPICTVAVCLFSTQYVLVATTTALISCWLRVENMQFPLSGRRVSRARSHLLDLL